MSDFSDMTNEELIEILEDGVLIFYRNIGELRGTEWAIGLSEPELIAFVNSVQAGGDAADYAKDATQRGGVLKALTVDVGEFTYGGFWREPTEEDREFYDNSSEGDAGLGTWEEDMADYKRNIGDFELGFLQGAMQIAEQKGLLPFIG